MSRIEPCGATDSIFSHELQKKFTFTLFSVSCSLWSCLKATLLCLIVWGSEIVGMGCRNLYKSLKGEEGFFKSKSSKSGKR